MSKFKRFFRKKETWPALPIWRTVKRGADFKNPVAIRHVIGCIDISNVCDCANHIMSKSVFADSLMDDPEQEYDLVLLTTAQLIGKSKRGRGTTAKVFAGADRLGLVKCPAWVGPRLRIDYQNQPINECIIIGMEPILNAVGWLGLFIVWRRHDSELCLRDTWTSPGFIWTPDHLWVFVRPRK